MTDKCLMASFPGQPG